MSNYCDRISKKTNEPCCHYDVESNSCDHPKRNPENVFLTKDKEKCYDYSVFRDKDHMLEVQKKNEVESYIPKKANDKLNEDDTQFLNTIIDSKEDDEFQSFRSIEDKRDQLFIWKAIVEKKEPYELMKELYPEIKGKRQKSQRLFIKYQSSIEELTDAYSETGIKNKIKRVASRSLDTMEKAVSDLEYEYENEQISISGVVKINKDVADIYQKYTKVEDTGGSGILVTFGDGTKLEDILKGNTEETTKTKEMHVGK